MHRKRARCWCEAVGASLRTRIRNLQFGKFAQNFEFKSSRRKRRKVQRALPASRLFAAMPLLESLKIFFFSHDDCGLEHTRTSFDAGALRHQLSACHGNSAASDRREARIAKFTVRTSWAECYAACTARICRAFGSWTTWTQCAVQNEDSGKANTALHPEEDIRMSVHRDDFVVLAAVLGLEHVDKLGIRGTMRERVATFQQKYPVWPR